LGLRLHLSITPALSRFATAAGCPSTREQITNEAGSDYRAVLKEYVREYTSNLPFACEVKYGSFLTDCW